MFWSDFHGTSSPCDIVDEEGAGDVWRGGWGRWEVRMEQDTAIHGEEVRSASHDDGDFDVDVDLDLDGSELAGPSSMTLGVSGSLSSKMPRSGRY